MVFAFPKHPTGGVYPDARRMAMDAGTTGKAPASKPQHGGLDAQIQIQFVRDG